MLSALAPAWDAPRASRCASTRTSMPARTPRSPPAARRTSSASRMTMRSRCTARAAALPGIRADRTGGAYRQPDPVPGAVSRRLRPAGGSGARAARGRPAGQRRSIAAAGSAFRIATSRRHLPAALAGAIRGALHNLDVRVVVEPGRWLVGPAGRAAGVRYPGQAHAGQPLRRAGRGDERSDPARHVRCLARHRAGFRRRRRRRRWRRPMWSGRSANPATPSRAVACCHRWRADARVAILDAGAYGSVMSSTYNARPVAAEVMVDGSNWSVIRERQSHADLWRGERVPHWLE